ncbi:MAG: hypothetical protein MI919_40890 [Holophagales bacterium]|nr:hypothetical protein [Holophagales bacterium]
MSSDVVALYRSDLRFERSITLEGDSEEDSVFVESFLAPGSPIAADLPPHLSSGEWLPIAVDDFGNYYVAQMSDSEEGETPIYSCDHEQGFEPIATMLTVQRLMDLPIRRGR